MCRHHARQPHQQGRELAGPETLNLSDTHMLEPVCLWKHAEMRTHRAQVRNVGSWAGNLVMARTQVRAVHAHLATSRRQISVHYSTQITRTAMYCALPTYGS